MGSELLDIAAARLSEATSLFVVTGAGISAESGIPTFRGPGGLWEGFRPEELATPQAFSADPGRVWRWYRWRAEQYGGCAPNGGHEVIAQMEAAIPEVLVATQNVDGLHRRAGNVNVVELHGSIADMRCVACGRLIERGCRDAQPRAPIRELPGCYQGRCGRPACGAPGGPRAG